MSFKEILAKDLNTFISLDEFADKHFIRGEDVECMVDSDVLAQRNGGTEFGIDELDIVVYAQTELLQQKGIYRTGYGSHLDVDGKIYTVISWTENMGMSTISLSVPQEN